MLLQQLPKIDIHRHLEGSLRLGTLAEIARAHDVDLPHDVEELRRYVQIVESDPSTMRQFLKKFDALRLFYRSPEIIERLAYEAVADCAEDNVRYLELRFTPRALSATMEFAFEDVSDWVITGIERAAGDFDIEVKLIVSMNRHESVNLGERAAIVAIERMDRGVVGLDLAGNEAGFPAEPFAPIFREAKRAGLNVTVHAGEWAGADSVREAIEKFGTQRLGHGGRIVEDATLMPVARDRGIAFEVCVTSNLQTGAVASLERHPLRELYDFSLLTTINTDNPSISGISLTDELFVTIEKLGLTLDEVRMHVLNAAKAAFLPEEQRRRLVEQFRADLESNGQS